MKNDQLAKEILNLIGGEKNVKYVTHCATRLRLNIYDENVVDINSIDKLEGVLKAQFKSGQLQVILGAKVNSVFDEFVKIVDITGNGIEIKEVKTKKNLFSAGLETLAGIFGSIIPVLIGCGMVKSLSAIITATGMLDQTSGFITILNLIGDLIFYFFPFFLAVSAAKKFKTNEFMAIALAGGLMYPTIMDGAKTAAQTGVKTMDFLGLPILFVNYKSTIIPIILAVWALSYVYKKVNSIIPEAFRVLLTPMLVLFIMIPLELIAIGPIGSYLGIYVAKIIQWLYAKSGIVGAFTFGTFRPFLVMFGMHYAVTPINTQLIAEFGQTFISPAQLTGNMSQAGACLGVYILLKNKKKKTGALSSGVTALFGITEPALYGFNLKYKKPMLAAMVSGGIGAAYVNYFGGAGTTLILPGLLALPTYVADRFIHIIIGVAISIGLAMVSTVILGIDEEDDAVIENTDNKNTETSIAQADVSESKEVLKGQVLNSPLIGVVKPLSEVNDPIFSQGVMGNGVAIDPAEGKVYAPFDGTVESLFKTKHAIGLKSENGVEVLIHLGIDTVNLEGKYFTAHIEQGQEVKCGDVLVEFDKDSIKNEGYDTIVPVIITNSDSFSRFNIIGNGEITQYNKLLEVGV